MGRGEVEIEMKTEMRNSSAGVKFPPESLLCILNTPKETLEDSCRPNSANIEDLGSNTLETGYGARRNTLAKCHLKIHSSQMPRTANPYPLSLPTFLSPSSFSSFLLSRQMATKTGRKQVCDCVQVNEDKSFTEKKKVVFLYKKINRNSISFSLFP